MSSLRNSQEEGGTGLRLKKWQMQGAFLWLLGAKGSCRKATRGVGSQWLLQGSSKEGESWQTHARWAGSDVDNTSFEGMVLATSRLEEREGSWRQRSSRMQSGEGHVASEPLRPKCTRSGRVGLSSGGQLEQAQV